MSRCYQQYVFMATHVLWAHDVRFAIQELSSVIMKISDYVQDKQSAKIKIEQHEHNTLVR